jgi:hypothetical protein
VFTETLRNKRWLEHLIQTLQHYPTFLNVDNVPEDTYESDEINQRYER